jgi:hypothetical protein
MLELLLLNMRHDSSGLGVWLHGQTLLIPTDGSASSVSEAIIRAKVRISGESSFADSWY